jgi:Domain of unknown function (DUF4145)
MAQVVTQEINKTQNSRSEVACIRCVGKTWHKVLVSVDSSGSLENEGINFEWSSAHQIIQCQGCDSLSYKSISTHSEDWFDDEDGTIHNPETARLYPPRLEGRKGLGELSLFLPHRVRQIYEETSLALAVQAPLLAGIGLRALIEQVCKEKEADGKDLFKKIDSLVAKQVLTPSSASILHKVRSLGNEAAHEVKPHTEQQLSLAMDVVEHLLKDVYVLPTQAENGFK